MESDVEMRIQETLLSINDVTLKIKKELEIIDELVKEDGHLHTVIGTANQILSKKVQEIGLNVTDIINENNRKITLQTNLLSSFTSTVEEIEHMNN